MKTPLATIHFMMDRSCYDPWWSDTLDQRFSPDVYFGQCASGLARFFPGTYELPSGTRGDLVFYTSPRAQATKLEKSNKDADIALVCDGEVCGIPCELVAYVTDLLQASSLLAIYVEFHYDVLINRSKS